MAKKKEETPQSLDAVLAQIRKEFGEGAIMRMGNAESKVKIPVISTGSFSLDMALGVGGLRRNRAAWLHLWLPNTPWTRCTPRR